MNVLDLIITETFVRQTSFCFDEAKINLFKGWRHSSCPMRRAVATSIQEEIIAELDFSTEDLLVSDDIEWCGTVVEVEGEYSELFSIE